MSFPDPQRVTEVISQIEGAECVSLLNEFYQKKSASPPVYETTTRQKGGSVVSSVRVEIEGLVYFAEATSKNEAKRQVAVSAVIHLVQQGEPFFRDREKGATHYVSLLQKLCQGIVLVEQKLEALALSPPTYVVTPPGATAGPYRSVVKVANYEFQSSSGFSRKQDARADVAKVAFEWIRNNLSAPFDGQSVPPVTITPANNGRTQQQQQQQQHMPPQTNQPQRPAAPQMAVPAHQTPPSHINSTGSYVNPYGPPPPQQYQQQHLPSPQLSSSYMGAPGLNAQPHPSQHQAFYQQSPSHPPGLVRAEQLYPPGTEPRSDAFSGTSSGYIVSNPPPNPANPMPTVPVPPPTSVNTMPTMNQPAPIPAAPPLPNPSAPMTPLPNPQSPSAFSILNPVSMSPLSFAMSGIRAPEPPGPPQPKYVDLLNELVEQNPKLGRVRYNERSPPEGHRAQLIVGSIRAETSRWHVTADQAREEVAAEVYKQLITKVKKKEDSSEVTGAGMNVDVTGGSSSKTAAADVGDLGRGSSGSEQSSTSGKDLSINGSLPQPSLPSSSSSAAAASATASALNKPPNSTTLIMDETGESSMADSEPRSRKRPAPSSPSVSTASFAPTPSTNDSPIVAPTYVELLAQVCAVRNMAAPTYKSFNLFGDDPRAHRCEVTVAGTTFPCHRAHQTEEDAKEDCAGDAYKIMMGLVKELRRAG
ncbi:hypothetical protein HK102_001666 [Quaeritorhiza haematococci]|nr:hypothetical protein HK102_001666 [Quaeritorhiza haematococci]